MRRSVLVAFLAASLPVALSAQNGTTVPASLANAFGNINNNVPLASPPAQYQQVFDGAELPSPYLMTGVGMRQDDLFRGAAGATVDLEINLGVTTLTTATLGNTFATNYDVMPPTTVLSRRNVVLPDMPPTLPTNPQVFFVIIPFSTPFPWAATASQNLLVQLTNRGNSNGNSAYSFPLDAGTSVNTSRCVGYPDTAATGTVNLNYGLVMRFFSGSLAGVDVSGSGCMSGAVSFYEMFSTNLSFDLAHSSIQLVPSGSGYNVLPGNAQLVMPTGNHLNLSDDSVSPPFIMPFQISYPGGTTNRIVVCSNGYIYLNGTGNGTDYVPNVPVMLNGGPRLFMLWMDLNPDATNNVYYNVDPSNARVHVTWLNVPEYGQAGSANTFQITINSSGIIDCVWQACSNRAHAVMTGFSPGANNRDPGGRDISATLPFSTSSDIYPLKQSSSRPIMGQNVDLQVTRIPAGSLAGLELIGRSIPGVDLTPIGMPTCFLYINPILITVPFSTGGNAATIPLAVPNTPSVDGVQLPVQALTISPGANPFGVVTSNLCTLLIGQG